MRKFYSSIHVCIIAMCFIASSCSSGDRSGLLSRAVSTAGRSQILFDDGWKFMKGDTVNAELPRFDDSAWRLLDLPHDWSIEDRPGKDSPFDSTAIGGIDAGYLDGGTGFYRKTFFVPGDMKGKQLTLQFDGVYMNTTVWLNGQLLGNHPYGYTGFRFNITDRIKKGAENIIAVKVSNEGRNSRWYSGSGIYRHVWLSVTEPLHTDPWHLAVISSLNKDGNAVVVVSPSIFNDQPEATRFKVTSTILDSKGAVEGIAEMTGNIEKMGSSELTSSVNISKPELWSPGKPALYKAITRVYAIQSEGTAILKDSVQTDFGIHSLEFTSDKGFLLNGQQILLKGGCMHHDNGPLGSAAYDRAEERRVELMKASGFNAIRCAHNPPSPAFLEACDKLGMMVIDEAFDMWTEPKNKDDYHLYFNECWKDDIKSMVLRDRNHPSVILWSIGNEIPESGKPEGAELAHKLADFVRQLDPTRNITSAVNNVNEQKDAYFSSLDVCGYNYAMDRYVIDHKRLKERVMVATESYPLEAFEYWMAVVDHPWVIGDFVWTGFDYLGEASIGWLGYPHEGSFYPWNHAFCGDIDICGFKRPQSFYRDALWSNGKNVSIFVRPPVPSFPLNPKKEKWSKWEWQDVVASWNWKGYEGKPLSIEVYSSCSEVELFLNDRSLGKQRSDRSTKWITSWKIPYEAGKLTAKGYDGSVLSASCELKTAKDPVAIRLNADRQTIKSGGQDLCYVTVGLLDADSIINPVADNMINFEIEGSGIIVATGSSDPWSTESLKQPRHKAYQGRCLVIIKSAKTAGDIILKAKSGNLQPAEIRLKAI